MPAGSPDVQDSLTQVFPSWLKSRSQQKKKKSLRDEKPEEMSSIERPPLTLTLWREAPSDVIVLTSHSRKHTHTTRNGIEPWGDFEKYGKEGGKKIRVPRETSRCPALQTNVRQTVSRDEMWVQSLTLKGDKRLC